jgi:DNA-binding Lrp family transcriptional regulator
VTEEATYWEQRRDAAVLAWLRDKKPLPFDELQELTGLKEEPLRESLYRLTVDGDACYDYQEGWKLPPKRRKLTRAEAITVLVDAAENWSNELLEYIIPAEDDPDDDLSWESNMETTANRRDQVARIEEAIDLLTPKKKEE